MPVMLVVDDEPLQREILKTILDDAGYETYTAASGEEALNTLKNITLMSCSRPEDGRHGRHRADRFNTP